MKKHFLITLIFLCFGLNAQAQFQFGVGGELWFEGQTAFGVQGKALYPISDKFTGNGSFTLYFSDLLDFSIDFGVQYSLIEGESFSLAPLAGIDVTNSTSTNTALQIGAFMEIAINSLDFYLEPKFILDSGSGFVLSGGILF